MRHCKIKCAGNADQELWDGYVWKHPWAGYFHLFGWRDIIQRTYGHDTYYLIAYEGEEDVAPRGSQGPRYTTVNILGVLPLVHLKHIFFGNQLVSLPFLDGGGILANCKAVEQKLLWEAINLGWKVGASRIELRHWQPLSGWDEIEALCNKRFEKRTKMATRSHKVQMLLALPESSEMLVKSFKSKLRSQIKKPLKEGMTAKVGGVKLLDDFYRVFLTNMRDLGSPVHPVTLMYHVLSKFLDQARVFVIYRGKEPVASSLVVGFNKILGNPWASSLRKYATLSPNMLLYLRMLEYACDHGYHVFDFGRSSPAEGTYKFKEQWGAVPTRLYWHYLSLDGNPVEAEGSEKARFERAIRYWKMLPLPVTRFIGPGIRKYIGL